MSNNLNANIVGGNINFGKAILAEGTNANTFKTTTNTIVYTIDGVQYTKAPTDNLTFSSGHTSLAASQVCLFAVWLDSAAAVTTTQGKIIATADLSNGLTVLAMPADQNGKCCIGLIRVATSASGVFVPNTTDLGDAQVTDTYYDCACLPARPITS
jgi:hypothetical protein